MVLEIMGLFVLMQMLQIDTLGNATIGDLPPITIDNIFGNLTATLITLVVMVAITVRTGSEAIEKWYKGEIQGFKPKYIITAAVAFVTSMPLAMAIFPQVAGIFTANYSTYGLAGTLAIVALYAYAWNHGTNKLTSLIGHFLNPMAKSNTTTGEPSTQTSIDDKTTNKPVNPVS